MIDLVRVDADALAEFAFSCFKAMELNEEDAQLCANALMFSELRFHPGQGQGVRRLSAYRERLLKKLINKDAPFEIIKESPALALVNGHNGLGSVVAQRAMKLAVDKAKVCGVGTVIVRGSTHYGSSAVHADIALHHNCLGVAMTNAGPEMAAWGGATAVVGTNPWAIAAPTGLDFNVSLDIALTTAGKGMMKWLEREGKDMPLDWALTPEGEETSNPSAAMMGALLGIGQYKGYGLSFMTDVMTGVLSGGAFGLSPYAKPEKQDVAHTFIAFDIEWFMPLAEFKERIDAFIADIKKSKLRAGFNEILVPGELEQRRENERRKDGVKLDLTVFDELAALAKDLNVPFPFKRVVEA